ncbi:MAG: hypothetical protein DRG30_10505 [Epsilonproteobacteria bacterium]|nr:MAG: hypothetical protein DRG30_10505 [Campylobacterota bacterium]
MKKIKVFKSDEVRVKPFVPHSFTQNEEILSTMGFVETLRGKSSKMAIMKLAKMNELSYDDEKIHFASEIINMMLDEME